MKTILVRCDNCQDLYELEHTPHHPAHFYLRLKYSVCPYCHHPRTNEKVGFGQFQCTDCLVIYTLTLKRKPVGGKCMPCYMRLRRADFNRPPIA